MRRLRLGIGALALAMVSCGSDALVEPTAATLRAVRGSVTIGGAPVAPVARAAPGDVIALPDGALARVELDAGARVVLAGDAELRVVDEASLALERGRAHVEARAPLELTALGGTLRLASSTASIDVREGRASAYVIRGELAYAAGGARGVVSPGHRLVVDEGGARVEPVVLFSDWTGGLAEAGPEGAAPVGLGVLEARVPEEIGRARWPLVVRRLDVRVRVEGDLAVTEIDQEFFNPASEMLEGLYRVRVPAGAILSRFAVDRNGRLVDGYVRERAQAQRAYEEQVYRGSTLDPALLEWDGPDAYRARIYPIYPGQTRRIVVRWAEWLRAPSPDAPRTYRFPMGASERAPRIQELSIEVDLGETSASRVRAGLGAVREGRAVRLRRSDFVPRGDFWIELFADAPRAQRAWRARHEPPPRDPETRAIPNEADERDYWVAPIVLDGGEAASEGLDVVIVADVSAGTDRAHLELGRSAVESVAGLLGAGDRVAIVPADLSLRARAEEAALAPVEEARVDAALSSLARAPAGGATDLGASIAGAAALLDPSRAGVVVYVGDGRATVGARTAGALSERLARLARPVRLYALAIGQDADLELLAPARDHGGLVLRVGERRDAAEAALELLAHAARPVVHGVTVELGDGIESPYPRRPIDVVIGDVLPIVGRVRGEPPRSVVLRGTTAGQPYERTIELETVETNDTVDPRLRWASARLAQLLAEGASREELVELGVRQGVITPYTSYYVPSAAELSRMGASALRLIERPGVLAERRSPLASAALALALAPFAIAGCGGSSDEEAVVASVEARQTAASTPVSEVPPVDVAAEDGTLPAADPSAAVAPRAPPPPAPAPVALPQYAAPATAAPATSDGGARARGAGRRGAAGARAPGRAPERGRGRGERRGQPAGGRARGGGAMSLERRGRDHRLDLDRRVGRRHGRAPRELERERRGGRAVRPLRAARGAPGAGPGTVSVSIHVAASGASPPFLLALAQLGPHAFAAAAEQARADAHQRRRCSDAAELPIEERVELWRERLRAPGHWSEVWREARASCELETWRDRRALLLSILEHAGSVPAMIEVARALSGSGERAFARRTILARVRTPEDVRAVRAAFGDEAAYDRIEQVLERAIDPSARISILRRLIMQYPGSAELKLRLLEELEAAGRLEEALRLAHGMRLDP
ncbi:MAG: VIT domain-containing protein [Sandaracinaceae bacterium]|nr:VIT domain-containing protein [Sandaracinaceae bacterium]